MLKPGESAVPVPKPFLEELRRLAGGFRVRLSKAETVLTETVGWTRVTAPYSGFDSVACERIALAPTQPNLNSSLLN